MAKLPETYEGPPKASGPEPAKPSPEKPRVDLFARNHTKTLLLNRICRALRDAPDDEMRKQLIREVTDFLALIQ